MKSEQFHARHIHESRARRYALPDHVVDSVKSSPAREEAHDPQTWFPLVALTDRRRPAAHPHGPHPHGPHPHGHGTVRPPAAHPTVVVRPSPAREEAHDPQTWFPLHELEALLAPGSLVEGPPPSKPANSITLTPVVLEPSPAPATVAKAVPTRAEFQRRRRTRRIRRRLGWAVASVGLFASVVIARNLVDDGAPSDVAVQMAPEPANESSPAAATDVADIPIAEPAVAVTPPPPPPPPLPNEEIWDRMAQCETGGNWQHRGPTWSGGLGIYEGTWREAGGTEFAALPRDATREQQIQVAERIKDRHGWTAWGCARTIGMG